MENNYKTKTQLMNESRIQVRSATTTGGLV